MASKGLINRSRGFKSASDWHASDWRPSGLWRSSGATDRSGQDRLIPFGQARGIVHSHGWAPPRPRPKARLPLGGQLVSVKRCSWRHSLGMLAVT